MTFFSILFALIAEQYRPVTSSHWIRRASLAWLDWVAKEFGGKSADGATPVGARLACLVGFGLPTIFVFAIYVVAFVAHPLLAFVWNIIIVYLFLGLDNLVIPLQRSIKPFKTMMCRQPVLLSKAGWGMILMLPIYQRLRLLR